MSKKISEDWNDIRSQIYSENDISASDLRVEIIGEIIKARQDSNFSQMTLSKQSGVKQPIIARMESGASDPRLSTILKILAPLGKTLKIVPINRS